MTYSPSSDRRTAANRRMSTMRQSCGGGEDGQHQRPPHCRSTYIGAAVVVAAVAPPQGWEPIHHNPRTLIVLCYQCQRGVVNETNQMRRSGWQELSVGSRRVYRCGRCSGIDPVEADR